MLNQEYEFRDVQFQINQEISDLNGYDVALSFRHEPKKEPLPVGTILYRLDFPIVLGIFMKTWWMKEAAFRNIFKRAGGSASELRQEWQNTIALRDPGKGTQGKFGGYTGEGATRTLVVVIMTTQPVYAWAGIASPLFHKSGGEEQVYLPNLAHGSGPYNSLHARLLNTYTLPTG